MAVLCADNQKTERLHCLNTEHVVGRKPVCDLILEHRTISSLHAIIRWDGADWHIKDLGSRNGTHLCRTSSDPRASLAEGQELKLAVGDQVFFGLDATPWKVVNIDPPYPQLVVTEGEHQSVVRLDDRGLLALPEDGEPSASLYYDSEQQVWVLERIDLGAQAIEPGYDFQIGRCVYRLEIPRALETFAAERRPRPRSLRNAQIELHVPAHEESASVRVVDEQGGLTSKSRASLYLLVYLSRERIAQTEAFPDRADSELGWVGTTEAITEIGLSSVENLGLQVHRCRKEIQALGVSDAACIVDRGRRGLLRIGLPAQQIKVIRQPPRTRAPAR